MDGQDLTELKGLEDNRTNKNSAYTSMVNLWSDEETKIAKTEYVVCGNKQSLPK